MRLCPTTGWRQHNNEFHQRFAGLKEHRRRIDGYCGNAPAKATSAIPAAAYLRSALKIEERSMKLINLLAIGLTATAAEAQATNFQ